MDVDAYCTGCGFRVLWFVVGLGCSECKVFGDLSAVHVVLA